MNFPIVRPFSILQLSLLLFAVLSGHTVSRAGDAPSPDDAYLDSLLGNWEMPGTFAGKPIEYRARGERVLQGGFLRLHMIDVQSPPKYEADLFLGYDATQKDFIAHWLDRFGAAGSRVVGTGKRDGNGLTIVFPYVEGAFRDVFKFDAKTGTWTLAIDSQGKDGSWSSFATYILRQAAVSTNH